MSGRRKSVLITGASGGVGQAAVGRLCELGWHVFAGVRDAQAGERLAKGDKAVIPVILDICHEVSITRARDRIAERVGPTGLDGLVNNAGASIDGPIELVPLDALRRQFELNVFGQVAVTQAFLPLVRAAQGRIVNMGGAAGRMTLPMYGALSASKGALDSISDALRMELKRQGVRVSYIEPGALGTDFFRKSAKQALLDHEGADPLLRALYANAIDQSSKALSKSRTTPVDHAVTAIVKALTASKPRARYVVGLEARMGLLFLLRMPTSIRDRILMSTLGLGGDVFSEPPARRASAAST